jgi:putative endonuclease
VEDRRRRIGAIGETMAAGLLELQGCTVLQRNVRCADVEIDLVARQDACLVLVEVKLRGHARFGAGDALGPPQRRRLRRAAGALFARHPWAREVRIDVVAIEWRGAEGRLCMQQLRGVLSD